MKRALSLLLVLVLLLCLVPAQLAAASSLKKGSSSSVKTDPAEFYTIGDTEDTFSGLYDRMCVSLDLKKHPLPKPDTDLDPMNSDGEYEYVYMLKDDDSSYEYIGYVCTKRDVKEYIVWSWVGYHEDGSVIGMDVYYTLEGKYLGNIQRDYSAGTSTSSHRCPYYIPGQPLNKK